MELPGFLAHAANTMTLGAVDERPSETRLVNDRGTTFDEYDSNRAIRRDALLGAVVAGGLTTAAGAGAVQGVARLTRRQAPLALAAGLPAFLGIVPGLLSTSTAREVAERHNLPVLDEVTRQLSPKVVDGTLDPATGEFKPLPSAE